MESRHPRERQARALRGLVGIYPLISIDGLFGTEDAAGVRSFRQEVHRLCEEILIPAGVPLLPSFEELVVIREKVILSIKSYNMERPERNEGVFTVTASLLLPVASLPAIMQKIENPDCIAIGWEMVFSSVATPEALLDMVRYTLRGFLSSFAKDFQEAQRFVLRHLPNGANAVVPEAKLTGYCLNVNHPVGGPKARVFRSALGITADNANLLREKLLEVARESEATPRPATAYGHPYEIKFQMTGPNGNTLDVVSGWLIDTGSEIPRLTSCYVDID